MNKCTKAIFKAKDLCRKTFGYMSALVYGMPCRPKPDCETLAVDQYGRMVYSPEFVESLTIEQLAYGILHECLHLALSHHKRFKAWRPNATERERRVWNIAADFCIYQILHKDAGHWEIGGIMRWQDYTHIPGIKAGLTTERYADILLEHLPDDVPEPPFGGSCADGEPKPGEPEGEGLPIDGKLAQVAEAVAEQERVKPGSTPGSLRSAIDKRLGRQPDPFEVLKSLVARSVSSPIGTDEYTYQKMPRKQPANCARRRGVVRLAPECSVVVDTSGSMSPYIERATTAVAQGLRRVHRPRVICWDSQLQSDSRMTALSQFSWDGGGGTTMAAAIEFADKKTDCIVCITDGETGWPSQPTNARLVVALVKPGSTAPEWARVVRCWEGADYEG